MGVSTHRLIEGLGVLQVFDRDLHDHRAVTVEVGSHVDRVSFLYSVRSEQPSAEKAQASHHAHGDAPAKLWRWGFDCHDLIGIVGHTSDLLCQLKLTQHAASAVLGPTVATGARHCKATYLLLMMAQPPATILGNRSGQTTDPRVLKQTAIKLHLLLWQSARPPFEGLEVSRGLREGRHRCVSSCVLHGVLTDLSCHDGTQPKRLYKIYVE